MTVTKNAKNVDVLRMLIRVYDVPYVKIQFNHSKRLNFISSWKMVKNTVKLYCRFFVEKTRGNIPYIYGYDVTYPEFKDEALASGLS